MKENGVIMPFKVKPQDLRYPLKCIFHQDTDVFYIYRGIYRMFRLLYVDGSLSSAEIDLLADDN